MMHDETVVILENAKVNQKYFKLVFSSSLLSRRTEPGQFVNILIDPSTFLRRPFSYYRCKGHRVEILYEVLGCGTDILSRKKKGDTLKVMGPLGKSFSTKIGKKKRVLIAGGIGLPPLVFLAEKSGADYLLIGTKSKGEILPKKELSSVKGKVLFSTDDGSYGTKGNVAVLLKKVLEKEPAEALFIQTCGPKVMMKAVRDIAAKHRIEGEASLDKTMACGIGACLGCMVKTKQGLVTSCKEGPVFKFSELDE